MPYTIQYRWMSITKEEDQGSCLVELHMERSQSLNRSSPCHGSWVSDIEILSVTQMPQWIAENNKCSLEESA